jgi:putative oxidoreductase
MNPLRTALDRLDKLSTRWIARSGIRLRPSITLLRLSLGLIFLGFGALKFDPGLSPAEGLAKETMDKLTLGLVPKSVGLALVALLESTIGVCLLTGRYLRFGVVLLGIAMVGILSPLVLFPDELFAGNHSAPTLEGQYVMKDVILLSAGLVVAANARGGQPIEGGSGESDRNESQEPTVDAD